MIETINTPDISKALEVEIGTWYKQLLRRLCKLYNDWNIGQMNFISRPMSEVRIKEYLSQEEIKFFTFKPLNMGDPRVMGYVGMKIEDEVAYIVDFLLSCRVWHRYKGVEELMLKTAVDYARSVGAEKVRTIYHPIPYTDIMSRNEPALAFLKKSGFKEMKQIYDGGKVKGRIFTWDTKDEYPQPEGIVVKNA